MRKSATTGQPVTNPAVPEPSVERISHGVNFETNPEKDLETDITDLVTEFKNLSLLMYRYGCEKADAQKAFDIAEALYEETQARVYKELKMSETKRTEAHIEAEQTVHVDVIKMKNAMFEAKHTLNTVSGALKSMEAKKDMLIQLGAHARKESI